MNDKYLRAWKRRVYWMLRIAPVVMVLVAINLLVWRFTEFTVVLGPWFSGAILIASVGLWFVALSASQDARYRAR